MSSAKYWRGTANLTWHLDVDLTMGIDIIIRLKPDEIVVQRGTQKLAPQTVRVDYDGRRVPVTPKLGDVGAFNYSDVVIIGYHNHPTEPDLDLKKGDEFALRGRKYKVDEYFSLHSDRAVFGARETN